MANIFSGLKDSLVNFGMEHLGRPFRDLRGWWWHVKKNVRNNTRWTLDTSGVWMGRRVSDGLAGELDRRLYHDGSDHPEKHGVICMCDGEIHHGGLTDRLRGILTAYREARRAGKEFYIYWNSPFELTDFLEPAGFDWRISKEEVSRAREDTSVIAVDDMSPLQSLLRLRAALPKNVPQIHLYTNADSARGEYRELYSQLFKPAEAVENEVARHKALLGEGYWAVSQRFTTLLGDFNDCTEHILSQDEQAELMHSMRDSFLELCRQIPDDVRILITSDSVRYLDYIRDADPRIYIVEGEIRHIDIDNQGQESAWMKTFVDQQLLMGADTVVLMRTGRMYPSGFPRFAAEVGGARFVDRKF